MSIKEKSQNTQRGEVMEYNLVLHALDPDGNMMTWKYPDIKSYLIGENHIHTKDNYKFYKAIVGDKELTYSDKWPKLMRDVGDFKTYCRQSLDREYLEADVPDEILTKFLLGESKDKRKRVYRAVIDGESIKEFYNNGGCGLCEYRPNYITGHSFFNSKGVEVKWNNENLDRCVGTVTRTQILNEIKALIEEGTYLPNQKPKTIISNEEQLPGQMNISDYL